MPSITTLEQLTLSLGGEKPKRVVVAAGHDPNTIQAAAHASKTGIAQMILVGDGKRIESLCSEYDIDPGLFKIIDEPDVLEAGAKAINMIHSGDADVLMKGLIGTGDYMRLILDKKAGLLPKGNVLTHITVFDLPAYNKLIFASDVAIIPLPDLEIKKKLLRYCIDAAHSFGIEKPKAALLAASEKVSLHMPATTEAKEITDSWDSDDAIVYGPLALDVARSPEACEIKGVDNPVAGHADILIFPNIESGNVFYKSSTLLSGGRLAAAVVGTSAPCVLTSRADSEEIKFLSIALGCRLVK